MKQVLTFILLLCVIQTSKAQLEEWPKMKESKLTEIRTTSDKILVAYFLGSDLNEIITNPSGWSINEKIRMFILFYREEEPGTRKQIYLLKMIESIWILIH